MAKMHRPNIAQSISITDMIARLVDEDYQVVIGFGGLRVIDDDRFPLYEVEIIDTDDSLAARGTGYHLIDALSDAYTSTPERKAESEAAE